MEGDIEVTIKRIVTLVSGVYIVIFFNLKVNAPTFVNFIFVVVKINDNILFFIILCLCSDKAFFIPFSLFYYTWMRASL